MRTKLITAMAVAITLTFTLASAADGPPKKPKGSAEFERMKSLVGTWKGKMDMGQGPVDMTTTFRLIAGGSVLEERTFPDTPNEMTTMYYDQGGKLALTHYCVAGNRPMMALKKADKKSIEFDFDEACGIDVSKEFHMHALKIVFNNKNTITTHCKAVAGGKAQDMKPCTLKRVK